MPSIGLGIHEIALENYRICKLYMNMMKVLGRQFNGDVIKINKSQEVKCNLPGVGTGRVQDDWVYKLR